MRSEASEEVFNHYFELNKFYIKANKNFVNIYKRF